jgi:predicted MFS family arabinose efflux permease
VFQQDMGGYSRMMAWSGGGAVSGALVVAWLGKFRHMGRTLLAVQTMFGLLVIAFASSRVLWVSQLLLFACGAALIVVFSLTSSLVQLIVPDRLRGRVMGIYMVAFRGGMPLGSLAAGYAATRLSAPWVLAANGALLVLVAAYFIGIDRRGVRSL